MIYKTRLISGEILKNQKENHTFFKKRKIDVVNQRDYNNPNKIPILPQAVLKMASILLHNKLPKIMDKIFCI